jgi:hypothetical protein
MSATSKHFRKNLADMVQNEDIGIVPLFYALSKIVGATKLAEMDPILVFNELEEATGIPQISVEVENKVNALITILATDLFHRDPLTFAAITNTLSVGDPEFEMAPELDAEEIYWASYIVNLFHDDKPEFSEPVEALIAKVLLDEGIEGIKEIPSDVSDKYAAMVEQLKALGADGDLVEPPDILKPTEL